MKLFKYLMLCMLVATISSCNDPYTNNATYPELTTITDTLWYSFDEKEFKYYDIYYGEETGSMKIYLDVDREELEQERTFSYTFTAATDKIDAIVNLNFDDGQRYGGPVIPKGQFQINNKDVYWIQLYELDDNGEIKRDPNGNYTSTILMWKE